MKKLFAINALFALAGAPAIAGTLNQCTISSNRSLMSIASISSGGKTATLAAAPFVSLTSTSAYLYTSASQFNATIANESPVLANLSLPAQNYWGSFNIGIHITCPEQPELARNCTAGAPYTALNCLYPDFSFDNSLLQPEAFSLTLTDTLGQDVALNTNSLPSRRLVLKQFSNTRASTTSSDYIQRLVPYGSRLTFSANNNQGFPKIFAIDASDNITQVSNINPNMPDYIDFPAYSSSFGLISLGVPQFGGDTRRLFAYTGSQWKQLSSTAYTVFQPLGDFQGKFYFVSKNSAGYYKMFRYDGTTFTQIADLTGSQSNDFRSNVSPGIVYNNQFYFVAYNQYGVDKLYRYDGTRFQIAMNINNSTTHDVFGSDPTPVIFNNKLYFIGRSAAFYPTLVSFDGTTAKVIQGVQPYTSSSSLTVYSGALYLLAGTPRLKIFRYDGTNLQQFSNMNGASRDDVHYGYSPIVYGGLMYFTGLNANGKYKLFALDGTQIFQVTDLYGPTTDDIAAYYANMAVFNNKLFVSMNTSTGANKLFTLCDPSQGCTP